MSKFSARRVWGPTPRYDKVKDYVPFGDDFCSIAGPCSVESKEQIREIANELGKHEVDYLRGGVFRAGTYPSDNFGLKPDLMEAMAIAAHDNGLKVIMEVLDYSEQSLSLYNQFAHAFQVGTRHMQDYTLLRKLANMKKPIFIKRGLGNKLDEFLGAAEHAIGTGTNEIFLIERGGASIHDHVRWDLSISMIPAVQSITRIPILIDGSHGTGRRDLVEPMTLAGIAAGANGFLLEVHPDPDKSISDADQAYPLKDFGKLMNKIKKVRDAIL